MSVEDDVKEVVKKTLDNLYKLRNLVKEDWESSASSSSGSETDVIVASINFKDCNFRRTEVDDAFHIRKLTRPWTAKLFGPQNMYDLMEKSVLSITVETRDSKKILAYAAFFDYPPLPKVQPSDLETWLHDHFQSMKITPLNTVFFNYFVSIRYHEEICAFEILKAMFSLFMDVNYVVFIDTWHGKEEVKFSKIFRHVGVAQEASNEILRICNREDVLPKLYIRPALVEDNDDLVVLFGKKMDVFAESYGEYFLSELIDQQQDGLDYCLVAETNKHAIVGFMSISKNIHFSQLERQYELQPFNYLREISIAKSDSPLGRPTLPFQSSVLNTEASVTRRPTDTSVTKRPTDTSVTKRPTDTSVTRRPTDTSVTRRPTDTSLRTLKLNIYQGGVIPEEKPIPPPIPPPPPLPPRSAFSIHLFMMHEHYESSYMDFIEAAFRLFSSLEFCIVSVACWAATPRFLSKFTRVTPKSNASVRQELYVLHRWGLSKDFAVRNAVCRDVDLVTEFLKGIQTRESVVTDLKLACFQQRNAEGLEMQAYIAVCYDKPIGIAIFCDEEDIEFLRGNFNIDSLIYFGLHRREDHARLLHFILNPIFMHFARLFIKEIFRLGNRSCFYYRIYADFKKVMIDELVMVIGEFLPVTSRRRISLTIPDAWQKNLPSDRLFSLTNDFSLTLLSRKHVFEAKTIIAAKIVIVGGSDTAFSIIKHFLESPFVHLTNLYLVSSIDIPSEQKSNSLTQIMVPPDLKSPLSELNPGTIHMKVSIIKGWMTEIDREKKCIVVDNEFELPYNYLILCCGKQYQIPQTVDDRFSMERITVNNHDDALKAINIVSQIFKETTDTKGTIIVHGNSLRAFCFVEALLEMEIPADSIVLIEPIKIIKDYCLQNKTFRNVLTMTLRKAGVEHLIGYSLDNTYPYNKAKDTVSFESHVHIAVRVACKLLVCFTDEELNRETFLALNRASLVYDGGLNIDHEFRTNDPWILAGGPMTKISRRYRVLETSWTPLSPNKIGKQIATQIFRLLDPNFDHNNNGYFTMNLAEQKKRFTSPIVLYGQIPRKLQCFHICKSNDCVSQVQGTRRYASKEISTGNIYCFQQPYIHFYFDECGILESITCISENPINVNLWMKIHGNHKECFNHLISKFDEGQIKDLQSYFSEPWATALLHDRFREFLDEAKDIFRSQLGLSKDIMDYFQVLLSGKKTFNRETRRKLEDLFRPHGTYNAMEKLLLNFLHYNRNFLPMYALPDMIIPQT